MTFVKSTIAAALAASFVGIAQPADAQRFGFSIGGPNFGVGVQVGDPTYRRWYHRNDGWRYNRWHGRNCAAWSHTCAERADGDRGDYRRCMRRHGCR